VPTIQPQQPTKPKNINTRSMSQVSGSCAPHTRLIWLTELLCTQQVPLHSFDSNSFALVVVDTLVCVVFLCCGLMTYKKASRFVQAAVLNERSTSFATSTSFAKTAGLSLMRLLLLVSVAAAVDAVSSLTLCQSRSCCCLLSCRPVFLAARFSLQMSLNSN